MAEGMPVIRRQGMDGIVNKYASRKFIVTMVGMILTALLAAYEKMTGDAGLVMTAAIGGYHVANAYVTGRGNGG